MLFLMDNYLTVHYLQSVKQITKVS